MLGTHTDISQRKQMEDELLQAAALQQALFEATPQYLAVLDSSCRVMKTNAIWDAYGLAKGLAYHNGWAGSDCAALLDAVTGGDLQIRRAALAGIADVISGRAPRFQMEYAFQAGAQLRSFTMSVMAVRDGQARAVVIHQDVSRFSKPHAALRGLDQAQGLLVKCFG
jgi:PAS domain-containing protein